MMNPDTPKAKAYFAKVAARNVKMRARLDREEELAKQQAIAASGPVAYYAEVTARNAKMRATLDREEALAKQHAIAAQVPPSELRRSMRIAVQNAAPQASYSNQ